MENDFFEKKKFYIEDKTIFFSGLVYFIAMLLFVGLKLCNMNGLFNGLNSNLINYLFSAIIQIGFMFLIPLFLFKLFTKKTFKQTFQHFSFKPVPTKTILISFVLGILTFILVNYISSIWYQIISFLGFSSSGSGDTDYSLAAFFIALLFTGLLPGFCEEFSHRGMMLGSIKDNGIKRAIVFSALLFALMHFNIVQFGYTFVVGLLLGFVTAITRSIFPAMIIHFTNNALSVWVDFTVANNWFGAEAINNINNFLVSGNWFLTALASILVLSLVLGGLMFLFVRLFTLSKQQKFKDFKKSFKKQIQGTTLEKDFDLDDEKQLMGIYAQMTMNDLQEKINNGKVPEETMKMMSQKPSVYDIMLVERDLERTGRTHKADYLFIYLAIILGSLGTFFSFIWGVI